MPTAFGHIPNPSVVLSKDELRQSAQRSDATERGLIARDKVHLTQLLQSRRPVPAVAGFIVQLSELPLSSRPKEAAAAKRISDQHAKLRQDIATIRNKTKPKGAPDVDAAAIQIKREYSLTINAVAVDLSPAEVEEVRKLSYVVKVHPDVVIKALGSLADSVRLVGASDAQVKLGLKGDNVIVAIVDTGIDYRNPDLGGAIGAGHKVLGGYDFVHNNADPMDDHGHGTHVAGIISANGRLTGVAPLSSLRAYKVLDRSGSGTASNIIAGIERAAQEAAQVMNLSLGGPGDPDDAMSQAIDGASKLGVVCVVAAGNDGALETIGSPGTARSAISVGASDMLDVIAPFSSRGPATLTSAIKPEMCAPGVSIESLWLNNTTQSLSGTSMATPHVAGAAALLRQAHPIWSPEDIKGTLASNAAAVQLPAGTTLSVALMTQGGGRINVYNAATSRLLVNPAILNLGYDAATSPQWSSASTLTLTNTTSADMACTVSVDRSGLPPGVTVTVPASVTVPAGSSAKLAVQFAVDNLSVADLGALPHVYSGNLLISNGANTWKTVFCLNKELGDTFEPNNTFETAAVVSLKPTRGQIVKRGRTKVDPTQQGASSPDEDWYRFTGTKDQVLFVYLDAAIYHSFLIPSLTLYDSAKNKLVSDTDGYNLYYQGEPRITFYSLPKDDTYYLQVRGTTVGP